MNLSPQVWEFVFLTTPYGTDYYLLTLLYVCAHCIQLCNPMDCSLPGSSVHGIFQARILERVALPFSRGSS